jgi:glycosyltransferase involved in cell wall biosynthesis
MSWFDAKEAPKSRSARRMRVVVLNDSGRIGGAERALTQLARNLDPDEFEIVVVCPKDGPLSERLANHGIQVITMDLSYFSLKKRSSYINYLNSVSQLYRLIKKLRVDILHCNSCRAGHWGVPLSWLLSVRTICHVRDSQYTRATKFLLKHAPSRVELIAISMAIKNALQSAQIPESRIRVIYNGEDSEFYRPDILNDLVEREFPSTKGRLKIGVVGRIVEWKRHIDLIEAAGLLKQKLNLHVFVVGELWGEDSADLSNVLHNRIRVLGLTERVPLWVSARMFGKS